MRHILSTLLVHEENVDDLINHLGTSRMVILKSVLSLLENGFIVWDEKNVDVIRINDTIYNNRYVIEGCIKRDE